jgi:hypothetical protein
MRQHVESSRNSARFQLWRNREHKLQINIAAADYEDLVNYENLFSLCLDKPQRRREKDGPRGGRGLVWLAIAG